MKDWPVVVRGVGVQVADLTDLLVICWWLALAGDVMIE